jgi:hypothetical protein
MRLQIHKILFLLLVLSLSSISQAQDFSSAKQTIDTFLHNWLIAKNIKLIEKDFSQKIFTSKYLLADGCLDVKIEDEERKSPQKVKQKTIELLQDVSGKAQGNSLAEVLTSDSCEESFGSVEGKLLSSLKEDKYGVLRLADAIEKSDDEESDNSGIKYIQYIKSKFPSSDSYLLLGALINYKTNDEDKFDYPIYIIWAKQNGSWKIIQIGMLCGI